VASPASPFLVDLHVHTSGGSADASLRPVQLGLEAASLGLQAVAVTEHFRVWTDYEVEALRARSDVVILPGREYSTSLGHILAFGVKPFAGDLRDPAALYAAAERDGGLLIAAHPFRYFFRTPTQGYHPSSMRTNDPSEAATLPIFQFVHAIEALNGHCTEEENDFALEVATLLGLPTTGGSDAHYADDLGRCVTGLAKSVSSVRELIEVLHSGAQELFRRRPGQLDAHHFVRHP
jgi:predicted metal-dependent phosphoesterase TrpH